jgi:hypothetical protein
MALSEINPTPPHSPPVKGGVVQQQQQQQQQELPSTLTQAQAQAQMQEAVQQMEQQLLLLQQQAEADRNMPEQQLQQRKPPPAASQQQQQQQQQEQTQIPQDASRQHIPTRSPSPIPEQLAQLPRFGLLAGKQQQQQRQQQQVTQTTAPETGVVCKNSGVLRAAAAKKASGWRETTGVAAWERFACKQQARHVPPPPSAVRRTLSASQGETRMGAFTCIVSSRCNMKCTVSVALHSA